MALAKADGANIYYEVIGQGEPLVLIQGYGHHLLTGRRPNEFVKIGCRWCCWITAGWAGRQAGCARDNPYDG
jgi:hypothetical protein